MYMFSGNKRGRVEIIRGLFHYRVIYYTSKSTKPALSRICFREITAMDLFDRWCALFLYPIQSLVFPSQSEALHQQIAGRVRHNGSFEPMIGPKQGDTVKIISSPLPESQFLVGQIGQVKLVDNNGIFEVKTPIGALCCNTAMVEVLSRKEGWDA